MAMDLLRSEGSISYDQFLTLRKNILKDAELLYTEARKRHKAGTGIHYPIGDLVPENVRQRYERQELLQYLYAAIVERG